MGLAGCTAGLHNCVDHRHPSVNLRHHCCLEDEEEQQDLAAGYCIRSISWYNRSISYVISYMISYRMYWRFQDSSYKCNIAYDIVGIISYAISYTICVIIVYDIVYDVFYIVYDIVTWRMTSLKITTSYTMLPHSCQSHVRYRIRCDVRCRT